MMDPTMNPINTQSCQSCVPKLDAANGVQELPFGTESQVWACVEYVRKLSIP